MWVVIAVETSVPWPTTQTTVAFEGHEILLRPETERHMPSVAMAYDPPTTHEAALLLVRRFLSSLAWVQGATVREAFNTGGGLPINVGKGPPARFVNPRFRLDYLPTPTDPRARRALALYREGLGLNSRPYQFLSFYKIINLLHAQGGDQQTWINATVDLLDDYETQERIAALRSAGENDLGAYLYVSGRCAVAHAYDNPTVDPDDPRDLERISRDLPIVRALAEYLIEHELGVLSQRTVWRQHLYELAGFREILGPAIVSLLKQRKTLRVIPKFPHLSVRLRDHPPLKSLEGMSTEVRRCDEGRLFVNCTSETGTLRLVLCLEFAEEQLRLDPVQGVLVSDDGSVAAACGMLDRVLFVQRMFQNGQLEVWDTERGVLLGRCGAFVPANVDLGATIDNLERMTKQLETEVRRRELGQ